MAKAGSFFVDDLSVGKYFGQRHRLWLRFDEGVWMTKRGWYEVTPESIARSSAEIHLCLEKRDCVLDLFCGCGGDTVQLARIYKNVIAVDVDPDAIEAAKKNAEVYGVADRITFRCCDFRNLRADELTVDAVHCSPPWGGQLYVGAPFLNFEYCLRATLGIGFSEFFLFIQGLSKNITMFLPRNVLLYSIIDPVFKGTFAIRRHYINERCKGITVFWGDLVNCSSFKPMERAVYSLKNKIHFRSEKRGRTF